MKALFCGLGGVGQRHLRVLKEIVPDIEIAAVRTRGRTFEIRDDMTADQGVDIEKKYGIRKYISIDASFCFNPDFAVVAKPTSLHVETTTELVKSGIPVLVEKPLSNAPDGVKELLDLSIEKRIIVAVGYMMRFHPCAIQIKKYVNERALGRIYNVIVSVNSFMPSWHSKYEDYGDLYAGRNDLGGGVLLTEIHEIDLLYWFFGMPKRVAAVGGALSRFNLDVEDTAAILLETTTGKETFPATINMSFVQKTPLRQFLLLGEFGKIEWDILKGRLSFDDFEHDNHMIHDFSEFERNDMFRNQIKHFLKCLESDERPLNSLENVLGGHFIALSAKESLKTGKFVEIGKH